MQSAPVEVIEGEEDLSGDADDTVEFETQIDDEEEKDE